MTIPQPIPYQGSKRRIAHRILAFFPGAFDALLEPFAGSAAVSLAAAHAHKVSRFHLNDINRPLMALWSEIIQDPAGIAARYEKLWHAQAGRERAFYDAVREKFNAVQRPDHLLYLLARCVKASVRYNARGEFNQSPDNRRKGRHPERMRRDIEAAARLLEGKTTLTSADYRDVLRGASRDDLVYMDPPYQGVSGGRDPRYCGGIDFEAFTAELARLTARGIPFILSFDGRRGNNRYGQKLPADLGMHRVEIEAGRSSQSTLLGRSEITYESLYLSRPLVERLDIGLS